MVVVWERRERVRGRVGWVETWAMATLRVEEGEDDILVVVIDVVGVRCR